MLFQFFSGSYNHVHLGVIGISMIFETVVPANAYDLIDLKKDKKV